MDEQIKRAIKNVKEDLKGFNDNECRIIIAHVKKDKNF